MSLRETADWIAMTSPLSEGTDISLLGTALNVIAYHIQANVPKHAELPDDGVMQEQIDDKVLADTIERTQFAIMAGFCRGRERISSVSMWSEEVPISVMTNWQYAVGWNGGLLKWHPYTRGSQEQKTAQTRGAWVQIRERDLNDNDQRTATIVVAQHLTMLGLLEPAF